MDKKHKYTVLILPVITVGSVLNGMISGIISVITAYFFKPLWIRITSLWSKHD